jgi:predicted transcriptional regulator of viral defense system
MNYFAFQKTFEGRDIIPLNDILKTYPNFDSRRLVEWQRKGYITKLINKFYTWSDSPVSESRLFLTSNKLYTPSYISLWSALRWYNYIPEGVYQVLAVTTNPPKGYETAIGNFYYQKIKPSLFFGYVPETLQGRTFSMAEPEKAFLDTAYHSPQWRNALDLESLRLNWQQMHETCNLQTLGLYAQAFENKRIDQLVTIVTKRLQHG